MEKNKTPLADIFISKLVATRQEVTVFLINGVKLSGVITESGDGSVILTRNGNSQLIMVPAVATIMPQNAEPNGNR